MNLRSGWRTLNAVWLRRLPMTAALVVGIMITTMLTRTVRHPLPPEMLARWGFGLPDVLAGDWWRLFWTPFFILRPAIFLSTIANVLFCCGAAEWLAGTRRTMVAAGLGHVVAGLATPLLLAALGGAGVPGALAMAEIRDVGASNFAFGALGLALVWLPPLLRRRLTMLTLAGLAMALFLSTHNWDVSHAIAFPVGYRIGLVMWRRHGALPTAVHRRPERHQRPAVVALVVAAVGIVDILSAMVRNPAARLERLETWLAVTPGHPPHMLVLMIGVVLLVLAPAIGRRRRAAWELAVAIQLAAFALHLPLKAYRLETALALALLVVLLALASDFSAPSDLRSVRRGRALLLGTLVLVPLVGALILGLGRSGFTGEYDFDTALRETGARLVFSTHHLLLPRTFGASVLITVIPIVGWTLIVLALTMIVRGVRPRPRSLTDVESARRLVMEFGGNGTSYMALWPRNALAFDAARRCFVAYRVKADVAVVLGDPIGPADARPGMIRAFAEMASSRGWDHIFYATSFENQDLYREAGYDLLQIGEEAVIPLGELSFTGKKWQNLRTAANRAAREGVTFQFYEGGSIPAPIRAQFDAISAEWEAGHALPAMEFTLGRTTDVDDPEAYVAAAVDAGGRVQAFIDWLPVPARQGWVIDLMRRRDDAMNGVMEYLIGMSLLAFQERGYRQASLATAPLADLDRDGDASPLQRLLDLIYHRFDAFYNFQSLFEFKARFQPRWEPVFLAFRGEEQLIRASRAVASAHLPDLNVVTLARLVGRVVAGRLPPAGAAASNLVSAVRSSAPSGLPGSPPDVPTGGSGDGPASGAGAGSPAPPSN